ncbi:MAG TPA: DnaJ domain-containing protein [Xanthobacteraceae bacterium]|nr:DnaJ domain-containing protein [Xanthobacteraceae bacterium]
MPFLLGVAILILLLWAINGFSKADPRQTKRVLQGIGGTAAVGFAALLLVRGEIIPAVALGTTGLISLGWISLWPLRFGRPAQISRVRTACVEIELNHSSGAMTGHILVGRHEGASLDALDPATLIGLLGEMDAESRQLLAAYLDRRQPGWREHAQGDAAAGSRTRAAPSGKMTEEEAYQVLGVQSGAGAQDIGRAHRSLMKKLHPDQGGSTYLAARVNEAKEVLLRRHR